MNQIVTPADSAGGTGGDETEEVELTAEEQGQVEELKARDREVRQHEQAHMAAAGGNARGGPSNEYQTGPDGKRYAVGGEVSIDASAVSGDPQATIRKAQQVYRAALAPAEPSGQDRSVAAQAKAMEMEARRELSQQQIEERDVGGEEEKVDANVASAATGTESNGTESQPTQESADQHTDAGLILDLIG